MVSHTCFVYSLNGGKNFPPFILCFMIYFGSADKIQGAGFASKRFLLFSLDIEI